MRGVRLRGYVHLVQKKVAVGGGHRASSAVTVRTMDGREQIAPRIGVSFVTDTIRRRRPYDFHGPEQGMKGQKLVGKSRRSGPVGLGSLTCTAERVA